jgi:heme/copper-type cytochrome/quinol oxidase subunit 4
MLEGFLLGVIVTASIVAAAFFWKFWRQTRDTLFLAFAAAFLIEGLNRLSFLFIDQPNEGRAAIYVVRLVAFLLIIAAIVRKNWGAR